MKHEYLPHIIEPYVQTIWDSENTFKTTENSDKEKFYCLAMIPYPSGKLHMGHVRNYTISDVIARYQRMLGKNVLHPIGWDAFGLPAENAAIQNKTQPSEWTHSNIKYMKKQLKLLGFSYDWNREITTCEPEYYKWEQWFFIELYKKNLVYKKKSWINWCNHDQTVLANEQVINGSCWRCNNKVVKKKIYQWFIKITKYAEELLNDLKKLPEWPNQVKKMQANWIGRSNGIKITLKLTEHQKTIEIFTPRPDTIMEATFIAISPFHKLASRISYKIREIQKFINQISDENFNNNPSKKNIGINTQQYAFHPITKEKLPIWIANYVLPDYGTGAILCVPEHNQNDLDFAIKYNLKIKSVILNSKGIKPKIQKTTMTQREKIFNSNQYNNLNNTEKYYKIIKYLEENKIGKKVTYYRLKDWGVSRQRYWGTPIPMAILKNHDTVPIPEKYLPVILPKTVKFQETIPIFKSNSEYNKKIYINGKQATYESDTFDTFLESSWYYARFTCTNFNQGMIDKNLANYWLPVDQYIGGIEHAVMHLIYFRFVHKLLRDLGLVNSNEPVKKLLCQGMVLSDAFYYLNNKKQKKWISAKSIKIERDSNSKIKPSFYFNKKEIFYAGMIKMSKSKNNGIEPENIIKKYGADTIRLFIMFSAPAESALEWKESGVKGMHRFLKKLWKLSYNHIITYDNKIKLNISKFTEEQYLLRSDLYKTVKVVSNNINTTQSFNTAISAIIKFVNKLILIPLNDEQNKALMQESLLIIIKMLYPFTPHFSFSIWQYLSQNQENIDFTSWPTVNSEATVSNLKCTIIIQINGKMRHKMFFLKNISEKEILNKILKEKKIKKYIGTKPIQKTIYIPNKIINLIF